MRVAASRSIVSYAGQQVVNTTWEILFGLRFRWPLAHTARGVLSLPGGAYGSPGVKVGDYRPLFLCMSAHSHKPTRVILVDDHPIVRAGIREVLKELAGVEVVGEASDGREAIELVKSLHPNVVFMDISMPNLNGLDATERIVRAFPRVRVIILSRHENEVYYWRALRVGASGYLLKRGAIGELEAALQRVAGGGIYLSREIASHLHHGAFSHSTPTADHPIERLSARQREILQLIAEGQTTKAIALSLNISAKTVEYHRVRLMRSLKIFDIPGLVRFALRSGLISQEV